MSLNKIHTLLITVLAGFASVIFPLQGVRAELVLSQLVVDVDRAKTARQDIEVWNNGPETAYVAVEPREILRAGTPGEGRLESPEPETLGLLVAPGRMVLEPGQRKLLRVAAIGADPQRERVYRVTVKPVAGQLSTDQSGLKILVGYDVLVLVRPAAPLVKVAGSRSGGSLILKNEGNVSVELTDGKQCDASGACEPLPPARLYAGAETSVPIKQNHRARYLLRMSGKLIPQQF